MYNYVNSVRLCICKQYLFVYNYVNSVCLCICKQCLFVYNYVNSVCLCICKQCLFVLIVLIVLFINFRLVQVGSYLLYVWMCGLLFPWQPMIYLPAVIVLVIPDHAVYRVFGECSNSSIYQINYFIRLSIQHPFIHYSIHPFFHSSILPFIHFILHRISGIIFVIISFCGGFALRIYQWILLHRIKGI